MKMIERDKSAESHIYICTMSKRLKKTLTLLFLSIGILITVEVNPLNRAYAEDTVLAPSIRFYDRDSQTLEFIGYNNTIELMDEEEMIKEEALSSIAAPCCSDFSALTCCCSCNLARSIWGLSNFLIREKKSDAELLKKAVLDWLVFINPQEYTGEACYTGKCEYPFKSGGCGGMESIIL